ncbi:GNAT family N-acetyltransferase [Pelagicoccus sp. SDUM812003]|uniref:GNAT family N-acetyltransferase n=1 Tax=Pelagicoccus sp. SDUM812003 TaxID=3041267 RepID=UPI00280CF8F6|nr:GNAT family N-acetyltransferase [Pelagicoccus sp. SDUM812003]MDQ8205759.1 GNAT family N-acetyltransferase [Pelagicoccus sp. SDUM812003]
MKLRNGYRTLKYGTPLLDYYAFSKPFPRARIREYLPTDYDVCSEIYSKNESGRFPPNYLSKFQDYLKNEEAIVLVIEEDSKVVGTGGICLLEYTDEITMAALSFGLIDPDYQRKGLGTMLLCARICFLKPQKNWDLIMTSAGNGTESFYKRIGFQFVVTTNDEFGTELESYHVKLPECDIIRFRKLIDASGSASTLRFDTPIPSSDCREAYQKELIAQQGSPYNSGQSLRD